jgi:hypothetical protein
MKVEDLEVEKEYCLRRDTGDTSIITAIGRTKVLIEYACNGMIFEEHYVIENFLSDYEPVKERPELLYRWRVKDSKQGKWRFYDTYETQKYMYIVSGYFAIERAIEIKPITADGKTYEME